LVRKAYYGVTYFDEEIDFGREESGKERDHFEMQGPNLGRLAQVEIPVGEL
jgi:hypothetical protein